MGFLGSLVSVGFKSPLGSLGEQLIAAHLAGGFSSSIRFETGLEGTVSAEASAVA